MAEPAIHTDPASVLPEENDQLGHAVEKLSILNDPVRVTGAVLGPQENNGRIARRLLRAVHAGQEDIRRVDATPRTSGGRAIRSDAVEAGGLSLRVTIPGIKHFRRNI